MGKSARAGREDLRRHLKKLQVQKKRKKNGEV